MPLYERYSVVTGVYGAWFGGVVRGWKGAARLEQDRRGRESRTAQGGVPESLSTIATPGHRSLCPPASDDDAKTADPCPPE